MAPTRCAYASCMLLRAFGAHALLYYKVHACNIQVNARRGNIGRELDTRLGWMVLCCRGDDPTYTNLPPKADKFGCATLIEFYT